MCGWCSRLSTYRQQSVYGHIRKNRGSTTSEFNGKRWHIDNTVSTIDIAFINDTKPIQIDIELTHKTGIEKYFIRTYTLYTNTIYLYKKIENKFISCQYLNILVERILYYIILYLYWDVYPVRYCWLTGYKMCHFYYIIYRDIIMAK